MTTDTEALVRCAGHLAEGDVLDTQGFTQLHPVNVPQDRCPHAG
jgi:hypothetical protein